MSPENSPHEEIEQLLRENQRLLVENNTLLRKMRRASIFSFWFFIVRMIIFIGVAFYVYFYLIEPYYDAVRSSMLGFPATLQTIPGWQQFYEAAMGNESGGE